MRSDAAVLPLIVVLLDAATPVPVVLIAYLSPWCKYSSRYSRCAARRTTRPTRGRQARASTLHKDTRMPRRCRSLMGVRHPLLHTAARLDAAMPLPVELLTDALLEPLHVAPVVARGAVLLTVVLLDVVVPAFTVPKKLQCQRPPCCSQPRCPAHRSSHQWLLETWCCSPSCCSTSWCQHSPCSIAVHCRRPSC